MLRLRAAIRKEFQQFFRDWLLLGLIAFIYTGDVIMCTMALSFEVRNLNLALLDQDRSQLSGRLVERFSATEYFAPPTAASSPREIDTLLNRGSADLALIIPPGFSADVDEGKTGELQVVLSGANSNTANVARGYANIIAEEFNHDLLRARAQGAGISLALPEIRPALRVQYNPELRFRYFMAISMVVVAAILVGVITTSASLVREKESGTVEQLIVTPLRRHEVLIAKALPPFTAGMVALAPSLLIARGFGVPMQGNLALLALATAVALSACMAIGYFIATFARNMQQALLIAFFVLFPVMFLSGTIVPIESMPAFLQMLSYLSPIRYYMEIALGILLKGVGLDVLWPEFFGLAVIGTALSAWSLMRLRTHLYG